MLQFYLISCFGRSVHFYCLDIVFLYKQMTKQAFFLLKI